MPAADDAPDRLRHGPLDQLRHDLKSPDHDLCPRAVAGTQHPGLVLADR